MTHLGKLGFLVALLLVTSAVLASTYRWNSKVRPPISLSDALAIAEKKLGEQAATHYCIGASLLGDSEGKGKDGAWNLAYASNDGAHKNVYIPIQGEVGIHIWDEPENQRKTDRCQSLEDVKKRLEAHFKKYQLPVSVTLKDQVVLVDYHTRDFLVYQKNINNEYEEKPVSMRGPKPDGIWLEIRLTDQVDHRNYFYDKDPNYWSWQRGTFYTTKPGSYLTVDMRYGTKLNDEVRQYLFILLGEPAK